MSGARTAGRRSRIRRAGESTFGLVLLANRSLMAAVAALIVVAGLWTSWGRWADTMDAAPHGTLAVRECDGGRCGGMFTTGTDRTDEVWIASSSVRGEGQRVEAAAALGSEEQLVRTGAAGVLHAWTPAGGALLLAAGVVWGGVRLRRTALAMAAGGAALLVGAFAVM